MTVDERPYFMENKDWYKFDREQFKYVLTDKAPKEAIDSYNEFYDLLEVENGNPPDK